MDVIILCGGKGSRLSEETLTRPKPMVEIGGKPILWHIMKIYSHYGYKRFILALGYKSDYIKNYFYNLRLSEHTFSLKMDPRAEPEFYGTANDTDWEIVFADTGENNLKGSRIKQLEKYTLSDQFHLTYGDGVSDVDLDALVKFHKSHGKMGTVTAVRPPSRFGELRIEKNAVLDFDEKPQMGTGYINGGFFVFNRGIFDYLSTEESCDFEFGPLQKVVSENQLMAFKHDGFWQPMDNIREKEYLDGLIRKEKAPWLKW